MCICPSSSNKCVCTVSSQAPKWSWTTIHQTPGGQYIHPLACMETGTGNGLQYVPSATAQVILSVSFVQW